MKTIVGLLLVLYGIFMLFKMVAVLAAYYQIYVKKVPFEKFKSSAMKSMLILHLSAVEHLIMIFVFIYSAIFMFTS